MFVRSFATFASAAILLAISGACGGGSETSLSPTNAGDVPLEEEATGDIGDFFVEGESSTGEAEAGGDYELAQGGTIAIPEGASRASIVVTEVTPTEDGRRAFSEWNPDDEVPDSVLKVALNFNGGASDYIIVTRPATDPKARIFATGYIDLETGDPDWAPVPTLYDSMRGRVGAAIGLGIFQPRGYAPQVRELSGPAARADTVYVAYIAVSVSGQPLKSEIEVRTTVPDEPFEAEWHGPDIQVAAQVGARFLHITHEPLNSMTVVSRFGPRPTPTRGASGNHEGVDYRAASGTTVYAAGDGAVSSAHCQRNSVNCGTRADGGITGGFIVVIDHGDGEVTRYMHMTNPPDVRDHDAITAGQVIGLSDATGGVAAHLHFEVIKNGVPVDPELIFNEQVQTTIAMAIDLHMQGGTRQELTVKRAASIEVADLEDYSAAVSLTDVNPGEHKLQFVSIQPSGSLEVVAEIPFTVTGGPFPGVSGHWLIQQDTRHTTPAGDHDDVRLTYQATFSLVAINDTQLQGQGHLEYIVNDEFTEAYSLCPLTTHIATSEWDVFWEGTYHINDDGSIVVNFAGTPGNGPDYESIWNALGCPEKTYTETLPGQGTPAIAGTLVNGEYYQRDDNTLDEGTVGEDYSEELIEISNSE